jgi:hypothetical protein
MLVAGCKHSSFTARKPINFDSSSPAVACWYPWSLVAVQRGSGYLAPSTNHSSFFLVIREHVGWLLSSRIRV